MIRIDQAHCNYHLVQHLLSEGGKVVYTDAGRTTRGGVGLRGEILDVFEQHGWPIPDIVSIQPDGILHIVEIDSSFSKAAPSLLHYEQNRSALMTIFNRLLRDARMPDVTRVSLVFCRTNAASDAALRNLHNRALENPHVDRWYAFSEARGPVLVYPSDSD